MNKKINLLEDGTKPSKITYDTNDCILSVDYPKSKFKIGDKVVVKNIKVGSRSTTETTFVSTMQQYINNTYTVKYVFYNGDVSLEGCRGYTFAEEWLQPLSEGAFNKGDIITNGEAYAIYKGMTDIKASTFRAYVGYCNDLVINSLNWDYIEYYRLATLKEQQILFDALEKEGKRWNAEALKVEDIEPLFKKGDILTAILEEDVMLIFDKYESPSMETFESIYCTDVNLDYGWHSSFFRPASKNEIKYLHSVLAKDGKKWNAETLEIEPIVKFKTGDKVRLKKSLNFKVGEQYNGMSYLKSMDDVKDAILTIDRIYESEGSLKGYNNIDGNWWLYRPEWLEHIVEDEDEVKFKRGDIVISDINQIGIFDRYYMDDIDNTKCFNTIWMYSRIYETKLTNSGWIAEYFKPATHEEQQVLFDTLAKEGKKWNAETLQVEEIKKEFKKGDILAYGSILLIFDEYANKERNKLHSLWNNLVKDNRYWQTKAFIHATDEQKAQVYELLRKDGKRWNAETLQVEDLDISEIVYNLSSACSYLNKAVPDFKSLLLTISNEDFHKYKAQITLQLIREAWNKYDGFVVDWNNTVQRKYYPQIYALDEYKISAANWITCVSVDSSCYCFKSIERAKQFGTQFKDLLKIAMGIK